MKNNMLGVSHGGRDQAGFSLIEMMITMGLTLVIMASTLAAMNNAIRASEVASLTTNMNQGLRTAMDIMVRDLLQVGQGLPSGRTIDIPNGTNSGEMWLPAGPNFANTNPRLMPKTWNSITSSWQPAEEITAVIPGPGLGPTINTVATDMITIVQADGAFLSTSDYLVHLTALDTTKMVVDPSVDISNGGADDLHVGDLILLQKGSNTTLVQITRAPISTDVGTAAQTVYFAASDSLNLNQTAAANGTLTKLVATPPGGTAETVDPATGFVPSTATRIRLISYYLDNVTDPDRPRLVRRVNNGSATAYDNTSGTAVAFDVENLQITYDLVDSVTNPSGIKMTAADLSGVAGGGGACAPQACSPNMIRKINLSITGRSRTPMRQTRQFFRNTLATQVSLRSMSFIDRYKSCGPAPLIPCT